MSKRELVEVKLEKYGFSFDVVKLNEEAMLDKLALTSPETGLLSRIEYQNFLFNETVLNLERFFHFMLEATGGDPDGQIQLRNLVEKEIVAINALFDADQLIISRSGVIKPLSKGEGTPLVSNNDWDKLIADINPFIIVEEFDLTDVPDEDDEAPPDSSFPTTIPTIKQVWERTNIELHIRVFKQEDIPAIFGQVQSFPNEFRYKFFVVNQTIVSAGTLFVLVDSMGLIEDVSKEAIVNELYELCLVVNPFLRHTEVNLNQLQNPPNKPRLGNVPPRRAQKKSKKVERKGKLDFKDVTKNDLLTLPVRIKDKVVGQDAAIDEVVETIQIASCGLRPEDKPIASYLLCGKTGSGKTLLSKVLAEELCGSREAIVRIDCSEYTESHTVSRLVGSPPGYVAYEEGGYLTNAVQQHPFSIVLFDEVEKANSKIFDLLLQIMDDARLTDGKGTVTSFRDCIILLTSNIGVEESEKVTSTIGFGDAAVLTEERRAGALQKALNKKFRPEFLNRIDNVINFRALNREDAMMIIDLLLAKVNANLAKRNIRAEYTVAVKDMVFAKGFSEKYGARPLERTIEKEVVKPIAQLILHEEIKEGAVIKVDYKKNGLEIKPQKRRAPSRKVLKK